MVLLFLRLAFNVERFREKIRKNERRLNRKKIRSGHMYDKSNEIPDPVKKKRSKMVILSLTFKIV